MTDKERLIDTEQTADLENHFRLPCGVIILWLMALLVLIVGLYQACRI